MVRVRGSVAQGLALLPNRLKHIVQVFEYIRIQKANHRNAVAHEALGSTIIVLFSIAMRISI